MISAHPWGVLQISGHFPVNISLWSLHWTSQSMGCPFLIKCLYQTCGRVIANVVWICMYTGMPSGRCDYYVFSAHEKTAVNLILQIIDPEGGRASVQGAPLGSAPNLTCMVFFPSACSFFTWLWLEFDKSKHLNFHLGVSLFRLPGARKQLEGMFTYWKLWVWNLFLVEHPSSITMASDRQVGPDKGDASHSFSVPSFEACYCSGACWNSDFKKRQILCNFS